MKAGELVEKLAKLPPDTEVIVWEGYNAGFATGDFSLTPRVSVDTLEPFVRLDGL